MPVIRSASPDIDPIPAPGRPNYTHGVDTRQSFIPMAFQVTSPFDTRTALLPHALVMHVNPQNFSENYTKKVERFQTRGGFVEQHWGDELSEVSGDGVTGAFMNIYTGLSSVMRQKTIAWDRYRDLYDLYRHNGSVYDPYGNIVLQGNVMLMYDRGTYIGYFNKFDVEETDDSPFMFKLSWSFKVEEILVQIADNRLPSNEQPIAPSLSPNFQTSANGFPLQGNELAATEQEVLNSRNPNTKPTAVPDDTELQRQQDELFNKQASGNLPANNGPSTKSNNNPQTVSGPVIKTTKPRG